VVVSVLRSVSRRRLVETGNPSSCATVDWKVCKSAIALYGLYLNVIVSECITKMLINPIIQTRTHHFHRVYHPARHIYIPDYTA
jgi:hypothetical protein